MIEEKFSKLMEFAERKSSSNSDYDTRELLVSFWIIDIYLIHMYFSFRGSEGIYEMILQGIIHSNISYYIVCFIALLQFITSLIIFLGRIFINRVIKKTNIKIKRECILFSIISIALSIIVLYLYQSL